VGEMGFPTLAGFASIFACGVLAAATLARRAQVSPRASLPG